MSWLARDRCLGAAVALVYLSLMAWLFLPKRHAVKAQIEELYDYYGAQGKGFVGGDNSQLENSFSSGRAAFRGQLQRRVPDAVRAVHKLSTGVKAFRSSVRPSPQSFVRLESHVPLSNGRVDAFADGTMPVNPDVNEGKAGTSLHA